MLLDVCFGTRTSWKILFVLAEAPGKAVSRKEIRKLTKLGNKAASKFLLLLEKFGIIIPAKIGKAYFYKLDLSNNFTSQILQIIQIEKKMLNNQDFFTLNILREFVYEMTNINLENICHAILFGSYAKRTFNDNSDIDVAIILKEKSSNDELLITDLIDKLNKRFKKEIQPHYFITKEFDKPTSKLMAEIVRDGIILI